MEKYLMAVLSQVYYFLSMNACFNKSIKQGISFHDNPAKIYLFKVNNRNITKSAKYVPS